MVEDHVVQSEDVVLVIVDVTNRNFFVIPAKAGIYRHIEQLEVKFNLLQDNSKNATLNG